MRAMDTFDIVVIGAGAAGMMCAAVAGQLGRRVALLDHAPRLAEKIRISGGGRCNFTNLHASPAQYLSANPRFCASALARYTAQDFLALLRRDRIAWHEKHKGQLFCDTSSEEIIALLVRECEKGGVTWRRPVQIGDIAHGVHGFTVGTSAGQVRGAALVVATGGLSIPKIGASDFAYRVARQFGLGVVAPAPALVPLTFTSSDWAAFAALSGIALEAGVRAGSGKSAQHFVEDLLLTHRGLSGPAILQISSYWQTGQAIEIDLMPGRDAGAELLAAKRGTRRQIASLLAEWTPARLAQHWVAHQGIGPAARLADLPDKTLRALGGALNAWRVLPAGTEGWRKAEVTRGGIDTRELSSATLMSRQVGGLYFIGEAIDVTGWLGGYNFQWAWSSGVAAARAVAERTAARAM
jgi:predicted Rossmann fold flavoprotein